MVNPLYPIVQLCTFPRNDDNCAYLHGLWELISPSSYIIISILYLQHTQQAFIAQSSNTERDQHAMTTPSDVMVVKRHASLAVNGSCYLAL